MSDRLCETLQEVAEHNYTGYLLSILHLFAEDDHELRRIPLEEVLRTQHGFRRAVSFLFRANPNFNTPQIRKACDHVEELIRSGVKLPRAAGPFNPLSIDRGQSSIPANILELPNNPEAPEYSNLIQKVGFEPEAGGYTIHSRAFDRSLLPHQSSNYREDFPGCGPRRDCFSLLQQSPCLLSSLGEFVREQFPGIQLIDVGAGTGQGIVTWAELFEAKTCIYIDKNYQDSSHERRGAMNFYRLKGDALHVVSKLPERIGSFHVAGMELLPYYTTFVDGEPYLRALANEMYKKAPNGGLLFVGQMHCSLTDPIVCGAGFKPVNIPRIFRGTEAFNELQWRRLYKVYRKEN